MADGVDYSIWNILKQSPEKVTAALISVVNVLNIIGPLNFDKEAIGGLNIALVLIFGLFYTAPLTVSKVGLQKVQNAMDDESLRAIDLGKALAPVTQVINVAAPEPPPPPPEPEKPAAVKKVAAAVAKKQVAKKAAPKKVAR